eukprot:5209983-Prymnesium_polylepis.1
MSSIYEREVAVTHIMALANDLSNGILSVLNVDADTYRLLYADASSHTAWKGRFRDHKGQFCKAKFEEGVIRAWSGNQWILALPWPVGQLASDLLEKKELVRTAPSLGRDFGLTVGFRAGRRALNSRQHRVGLRGRRNHFVRLLVCDTFACVVVSDLGYNVS